MAEIQLAPARALMAPPSSFIYGRTRRPIVTWRTGHDEAAIAGICSESDGSRGDRLGAAAELQEAQISQAAKGRKIAPTRRRRTEAGEP